jgi:hypothetical protein
MLTAVAVTLKGWGLELPVGPVITTFWLPTVAVNGMVKLTLVAEASRILAEDPPTDTLGLDPNPLPEATTTRPGTPDAGARV